MGEDNPFNKLTWDGSGFKTARDKVNESFDALIAGAGNQQAMATGMAGGQSGRIAAETFVNAAGQRNQSEAQLLTQEASAKAQFTQDKQMKSAQWEAERASPLDFIFNTVIPAGTGIASMFFPPAALGTVGSKLIGGALNKPNPTTNTTTTSPTVNLGNSNTPGVDFQSKFNGGNLKVGSGNLPNLDVFKIKQKSNPFNFIPSFGTN